MWFTDLLQNLANQLFSLIPQAKPSEETLSQSKIVAHRGAWLETSHPENTLAAFRACLGHRIWAIEFDIRWTQDNIPVVHHDKTTQRVFNKDLEISSLNFAQLRKELPLIPKLEEVVTELANQLHFMIEIKETLTTSQIEILKGVLKDLTPEKDYHFMSLDIQKMLDIDFCRKKTFISVARTNIKDIYNQTMEHNLGGLTGQYLLLSDTMHMNCANKLVKTGTGFPTNKNLFYREINRGIDWIYTNHPLKLSNL